MPIKKEDVEVGGGGGWRVMVGKGGEVLLNCLTSSFNLYSCRSDKNLRVSEPCEPRCEPCEPCEPWESRESCEPQYKC